jgi:hypothetical protein
MQQSLPNPQAYVQLFFALTIFQNINFLSLSRPDLLSDIVDKLELGKHLVLSHTLSTNSDTSEAALRADANLLKSLLQTATLTISDDLGSVEHAVLDDLSILKLGFLGGDDSEDDVLVLREEAKGLETAGTRVVVLEEEGVVVEDGEELLGDLLV